ncbi:MAG: 50S ribosomal protein L15 [bacterium]|nr:50S ribosomal protein L15 [bacterium]
MEASLHNLQRAPRKQKRRVGRGNASGRGTYSGRGQKGQKARSGGNIRPGFEGGRMPLIRQIPKTRGFRSRHLETQVVNLGQLETHFTKDARVTPAKLVVKGLIQKSSLPVKILGQGTITKAITVVADGFSKSAKDGITKAGGSAEIRKA